MDAEPMSREIQNRIVACVGRKGVGKSTWLGAHLGYCPRFVVFDPLAEYDSVSNRTDSLRRLEQFLNWSRDRDAFAARYIPSGEPEEEIEGVSALVYERGDLCLVCEEIALYTQPGYAPPLLGKLVRTGRHRGIDICWATQRPAECSKTITALTDLWGLFSLTEPRDIEAISVRCGPEIADRVVSLKHHEHFVWDAVNRKVVEDSPRLLKR
jgi:hypothetical protein